MPFHDDDTNVITRPKAKPKIAVPKMWAVVLVNDDFTPMDFVVYVIVQIMRIDMETAVHAMLQAHKTGRVKLGSFSKDVAETKATEIMDLAKQHEHPLVARAEEAD